MLELSTPVKFVKGIGPRIAEMLAEKGIATVEDLLYYLPFRYEDRINPRPIAQLKAGEMASVIGEVRNFGMFQTARSRTPIFQLAVADPGGRVTLRCIWFHATYLRDKFHPGQMVALYGKVEIDTFGRGGLQMVQPELEFLTSAVPAPASAVPPNAPAASPRPTAPFVPTSSTSSTNACLERSEGSTISSPAVVPESLETGRIVPIYETAGHGKLTSRWFRRIIHNGLEDLAPEIPDGIPPAICARRRLVARREAFWRVHFPDPGERFQDLQEARTPAHQRLIFEELFFLELGLELKRRRLKAQPGIAFEINDPIREVVKKVLPFHPTNAQKKVMKEIAEDMRRAVPMRRLLQGDVGSGKTIIAFQAAIIAIENGYQVALMAPTEILATQHYLAACRILEKAGYRISLLTGSVEPARKRELHRRISQGDVQLVVGTHALIQEAVEFARLGLVIVDEQHRFGVMQRFRLMKKQEAGGQGGRSGQSELGSQGFRERGAAAEARAQSTVSTASSASTSPAEIPESDVIIMTATPIPRTLALTLYGDLDVSVIDEMPPGRTPIETHCVTSDMSERVWKFVRKQVEEGRQAFVVYPLVDEEQQAGSDETQAGAPSAAPTRKSAAGSAGVGAAASGRPSRAQPATLSLPLSSAGESLKAAVQMFEELRQKIFPDLHIGLLHGRLRAEEKELAMSRFTRGEIDVLVATTVIEVGVDVPNANIMVVEHAERFGLSQLHQLRGRIGRGAAQSYCVLITGAKVSPEAAQRLDALVHSTDGFKIAELDLQLRGPGEFFSTRQAGMPDLRVANIVRDQQVLQVAKREAATLVAGPTAALPAEDIARAIAHLRTHWQRRYGLVEAG
jgi:ATP-dependent DNA helicase RecG